MVIPDPISLVVVRELNGGLGGSTNRVTTRAKEMDRSFLGLMFLQVALALSLLGTVGVGALAAPPPLNRTCMCCEESSVSASCHHFR